MQCHDTIEVMDIFYSADYIPYIFEVRFIVIKNNVFRTSLLFHEEFRISIGKATNSVISRRFT